MHSRMHFVQLELNCFPFAGLFCGYFKLVCDYFKAKHRQTMKLGLKTYNFISITEHIQLENQVVAHLCKINDQHFFHPSFVSLS